jgi:transcriptional regulator with XRE-family HTH domain
VARPGISAQKKRRIREMRAKGMTMAEVAERVGVSLSTVVRYAATPAQVNPSATDDTKESKSSARSLRAAAELRKSTSTRPASRPRSATATSESAAVQGVIHDGSRSKLGEHDARLDEFEQVVRDLRAQLAEIAQRTTDLGRLLAQRRPATETDGQRLQSLEDEVRMIGADLRRLRAKKPRLFR